MKRFQERIFEEVQMIRKQGGEAEALHADLEAVAVAAWEYYGWIVTRSTDMRVHRLHIEIESLGEALARPSVQAIFDAKPEGEG